MGISEDHDSEKHTQLESVRKIYWWPTCNNVVNIDVDGMLLITHIYIVIQHFFIWNSMIFAPHEFP